MTPLLAAAQERTTVLTGVDWVAIAAYFSILLGVAWWVVKRRKDTAADYFLAGRNLGAHGPKMFAYVLLPASLPHLVTGLKQGWAFAWRSLISGEMLFVSLGLGQMLIMGRDLNDMSQVLAVMGLIMVTGHVVDQVVFEQLEKRVRRRWGLAGETA